MQNNNNELLRGEGFAQIAYQSQQLPNGMPYATDEVGGHMKNLPRANYQMDVNPAQERAENCGLFASDVMASSQAVEDAPVAIHNQEGISELPVEVESGQNSQQFLQANSTLRPGFVDIDTKNDDNLGAQIRENVQIYAQNESELAISSSQLAQHMPTDMALAADIAPDQDQMGSQPLKIEESAADTSIMIESSEQKAIDALGIRPQREIQQSISNDQSTSQSLAQSRPSRQVQQRKEIIMPQKVIKQQSNQSTKQTPLELKREHSDQLLILLAELRKDINSQPFHEPVPWQALGLWNYLTIVKKPMDLATVRTKVQTGTSYSTVEAFAADLQQIWTNCKLYNQQGSPIYVQAEKMERKSKKLVKNLRQRLAGVGDNNGGFLDGSAGGRPGVSQARQLQLLKERAKVLAEKEIEEKSRRDRDQLQRVQSSLARAQSDILQSMSVPLEKVGPNTRDSLLTSSSANKFSTEPTPPKPDQAIKRGHDQRQQQLFDETSENPRPLKQQRRENDEIKNDVDNMPSEKLQQDTQDQEVMELETESMIGDCLLSEYARQRRPSMDDAEPTSNLIFGRQIGSDVDQLELIEEQVAKKVAAITDIKMLNQVAQMGDDQILAAEVCQICGWLRNCKTCLAQQGAETVEQEAKDEEDATQQVQEAEDDEEDDDDDFECDIERYVPYEEKMKLADRLKTCSHVYSKECLTEIMRRIGEAASSHALEDYGNGRVQLKIDLIERDVYHDILKIFDRHEELRQQASGHLPPPLREDGIGSEQLSVRQSQLQSESAGQASIKSCGKSSVSQQIIRSHQQSPIGEPAALGFHQPIDELEDEDELIDVTDLQNVALADQEDLGILDNNGLN